MARKRINSETVLAGTEKQAHYWTNQKVKIKLFISVIIMGILVILIEIFIFNK